MNGPPRSTGRKAAPPPVVLVVGADAILRARVRRLLRVEMLRVVEVATSEAAQRRALQARPAVIMIDVGLNATDLAHRLASLSPASRIVLLTHGQEAYLSATGKTGAHELLPKASLRTHLVPLVLGLAGLLPAGAWDGRERRLRSASLFGRERRAERTHTR